MITIDLRPESFIIETSVLEDKKDKKTTEQEQEQEQELNHLEPLLDLVIVQKSLRV